MPRTIKNQPLLKMKRLTLLIILAFVFIYLVSVSIIGIFYYNSYEGMMAEKLEQSVASASFSYVQSFFDTIKREALELVKEPPLTDFLNGNGEAGSTEDFLRYRTDVSVSQYIEVYSAEKGEAVVYDEPSDSFRTSRGNSEVDFADNDCVILPVNVLVDGESEGLNYPAMHYTIIYQKISEDGSYIATGLSAHVTRASILAGFILPHKTSFEEIRNGEVDNTTSNFFLVNPDGTILSDYYARYAGQSLTQYNFYSDFKESAFEDEYQIVSHNKSTYLMSCAYQQKPGMYIVGVIQKQDIVAAVMPTLLTLSVLIFIALTITCLLCNSLVYKAFSPYEKLVKKVSKGSASGLDGAALLGAAIEKGAAAEQKAYEKVLSDYILDRATDYEIISDIEQKYPGGYVPITCKIDDYDDISPPTLNKCRKVIEDIFCLMGKILCLYIDKNKLLFILCGENTEKDVTEALKECQDTLEQSDISTSYIIGKKVKHLKDINDSYCSMRKMIFMSVCYGEKRIISDSEVEDHIELPSNLTSTLIGYINECDNEKINKYLDKIFYELRDKKSALISIYLLQITLSIISHITSFNGNQNMFDYQDIIDRVTEASSLSAAKKIISQLCYDACNYLSSIQNKAKGKQEIETRIIEYLNENYSNPNLSLTFISNVFGYSPKYLGHIFKNYNNMFFTQYLTELRMKKAQELILNTDLPIAEIYKAVGITTLQHFYRLFKKQFGYSPAAMRKTRITNNSNRSNLD